MAKHAALSTPYTATTTLAVRNGGNPYPHVAQLPKNPPRHSTASDPRTTATLHPVYGIHYTAPAPTWADTDHRGANR